MLGFGTAQGFLPLRQQLQTRLAEVEIGAKPEQIVLVSGITQAIDLIARIYVKPGDAVIVGDPAWFQMFGRFAAQGAQLVGMPYTSDGPDLDALETLVQMWRPKMLVINSVLQNPTGTSLSAAQAFRILKLAEAYDFLVVEDDVYGDLCPPSYPATRLASLDQLKRVIYLGSYSKTLAANLRVGYVACAPEIAKAVTDQKMLVGMTTPGFNERVLYKILTEGHYRRHVERLRARLDGVRDKTARMLERTGPAFSRCRRPGCSCGPTRVSIRTRSRRSRTRPAFADAGQPVLTAAIAVHVDALQRRELRRSRAAGAAVALYRFGRAPRIVKRRGTPALEIGRAASRYARKPLAPGGRLSRAGRHRAPGARGTPFKFK